MEMEMIKEKSCVIRYERGDELAVKTYKIREREKERERQRERENKRLY
jgi:hypothetical protein